MVCTPVGLVVVLTIHVEGAAPSALFVGRAEGAQVKAHGLIKVGDGVMGPIDRAERERRGGVGGNVSNEFFLGPVELGAGAFRVPA